MSDAGPSVQEPQEPIESVQPVAKAKKPGMLADPVVRTMTYVVIGLVVVFLIVVIGVVLSGVATPTGPRTADENELAVSGAAVRSGKADSATWGNYIAALIANRRYGQAQNAIKEGKASVPDTQTAAFAVAEVRLASARKQYDKAITVANQGQKEIEVAQKAVIKGGGLRANRAKLSGLHENYYILALLKADAYTAMGQWDKAIKELDVYIARNPDAADILIDRGNAKLEVKDTAGAKKDFTEALKYVPEDAEAQAGLDKIGATNK